MSRRAPNPAAERAAKNQQTLKSLLKLEPNKTCADCKRNKHPRWASWNLGIFVCIRCSGVHRSMGTHISRVKSVDLDTWTDEQLQSILSWGNARANKFWEAKLAPGHVPSEAKIENFIRTKYELKRWAMDGPVPDPATLDVDGDDDIPLSLVKEKQTIDRKESIRKTSVGKSGAPAGHPQAATAAKAAPAIDLMGGGDLLGSVPSTSAASASAPPPPRASTAGPAAARVAPKSEPAQAKPTTTTTSRDSLLGLDFFGSQPAAPQRPASTTGGIGGASSSSGPSRPDLKQSILSLYATAPRVQPAAQPAAATASRASGAGSANGGLVDAFSSLSFSAAPAPPSGSLSPKPADAFSGLAFGGRPSAPAASSSSAFSSLSGGSFFDTRPAAAATPPPPPPKPTSPLAFGSLDVFSSMASSPAPSVPTKPAAAGNAFGSLLDFSAAPTPAPAPSSSTATPGMSSVFHLSSPAAKPAAASTTTASASPMAAVAANWSNADVWGNDAGWGSASAANSSSATSTATTTTAHPTSPMAAAAANDFSWSSTHGSFATQSIVPGAGGGFSPAPKVAADEEFGGWASSSTTAAGTSSSSSGAAKPVTGGFGAAGEDLFSNVWG